MLLSATARFKFRGELAVPGVHVAETMGELFGDRSEHRRVLVEHRIEPVVRKREDGHVGLGSNRCRGSTSAEEADLADHLARVDRGDRLASYDDLGFACLDDVGHQIDVALLDKCSPS